MARSRKGRFTRRHHSRRRRRSNPRRHHRSFMMANRGFRHFRRHRRNPSIGGMSGSDLLYAGGGALVNGILARVIPQSFASQYNKGLTGYAMNVGTGALGAWLIGKVNRKAGFGAWIGMIVAVGQRVISDNFGAGTAAATGGMSGDLDMDLGYYLSDTFPYPQGSGGPYPAFPGTPYMATPALPATAATAVTAGRAAAAAALPAAGASQTPDKGQGFVDRWAPAWT
jgi:hypothetical protein